MLKSVVYQGNSLLGEVEIYPNPNYQNQNQIIDLKNNKDIRITHFSQPSERCPPLAVLHTIAPFGVCFKLESSTKSENSPLFSLHSSCLRENKVLNSPILNKLINIIFIKIKFLINNSL